MTSRVAFTAVLMLVAAEAKAQEDPGEKSFGLTGLGFGYGYQYFVNESRIRGNVTLTGLTEFFVSRTSVLNIRTEYTSAGTQYNVVDQYLQSNASYTAVENFSWRNVTLAAVLRKQVSGASSLGAGVGVEYMHYHRSSGEANVTTVDPLTHSVSVRQMSYDVEWVRMSPSIYALANTEWELKGGAKVMIQVFYKFIFTGREIGRMPLNSLNAIGVTAALMHVLDR